MPQAKKFDINKLDSNDTIDLILGTKLLRTDHGKINSLVVALLNDSRMIGGRNTVGSPNPGVNHACWMACLGYLIFLEQIGKCFQAKNWKRKRGEKDIETILRMYTHLSKGQREAIYALRCALAHGYNLTNPNQKQQTKNQRFILKGDNSSPLIKLRTRKWDGNPSNANKNTFTAINIVKLENLCEEVYCKLVAQHQAHKLKLRPGLKPKDVFLTYMMHSY
jgi:hypothetical protein